MKSYVLYCLDIPYADRLDAEMDRSEPIFLQNGDEIVFAKFKDEHIEVVIRSEVLGSDKAFPKRFWFKKGF